MLHIPPSATERPHRGTVLVVEDEPPIRAVLIRLLLDHGYAVDSVNDGETALDAVEQRPPDLVLLDLELPGIDGFEVCHRIKQNPMTRLTPVVLVTGLYDRERKIRGIEAGADDFLSKPFDVHELTARVGSLVRFKRYTDELESAESVILSLALTVEARDPYTEGHCQRLAKYAMALGRQFGVTNDELAALHWGGYLHDVGKIGVPDSVLQKPSTLTETEYELMKQHTIIGERLCGRLRTLSAVRPIVRHHHERRDGSGYPDGLRSDEVPLLAEIVGVVDLYDAITTTRPYRPLRPAAHAYEELAREVARGRFRQDLVDAFIALGRRGVLEAMATTVAAGDAPLPTGTL